MKLIDYIMQTSEEIEDIKSFAKYHEMTLEDYILDSYCPSYFECLKILHMKNHILNIRNK